MKKRYIKILLAIAIPLIFFSCKKDNADPELYAYISPDFQPGSTFNYLADIKRTPIGTKGDSMITVQPFIRLTRAVSSDVPVTFSVDTNLVYTYNTTNGTAYKVAPNNSYKLEIKKANGTIVSDSVSIIKAGKVISSDSLIFTILTPQLFTGTTKYMVPVKLTHAEGVEVSNKVGVLYIVPAASVSITNFENINNNAVSGNNVPRAGWTVTASSTFSTNVVSRILDSLFNTSWMSSGTNPTITLDMGAVYTLKGFNYSPAYPSYTTYYALNVQVNTSIDNVEWVSQGTFLNGTAATTGYSATNPEIKGMKFIMPVTCRYVKLTMTKGGYSASYWAISELFAVQ